VDLAPSAYDMIVASLPQSNSNHAHQPSEAEQVAHLPAHVKSAWQRSKQTTSSYEPMSTRAQGKQPQRGSPLPNESFVMLQDSAIRNIPSQSMSTPRKSSSVAKVTSPNSIPNSQSLPVPPAQLQPDTPNPTPISHHLRSTLRLFNHLSTRTEIDHPLCAECTHILLTSLQRQLDETKKERDGYIAFEKEVKKEKEKDGQGMSREEAEKKIEKLKVEEKVATENLKEAEREREKFDKELKALEEEEKALEEEEAE
jgi:beclin 1